MQSRKHSLLESVANTVTALIITMGVLPLVNWICGVEMNWQQLTAHVGLMTLVSVGRNYIIRRVFNSFRWLSKHLPTERIFKLDEVKELTKEAYIDGYERGNAKLHWWGQIENFYKKHKL
jgi:hypothetical protein